MPILRSRHLAAAAWVEISYPVLSPRFGVDFGEELGVFCHLKRITIHLCHVMPCHVIMLYQLYRLYLYPSGTCHWTWNVTFILEVGAPFLGAAWPSDLPEGSWWEALSRFEWLATVFRFAVIGSSDVRLGSANFFGMNFSHYCPSNFCIIL